MVINIIGECDKRPVLYTLMKICQTLGDVLVISNNTRLKRLSDTRETYGHYQNTMIAITSEGIDDFFDDFAYDLSDYEFVIIDNIIKSDADLYIYVKGFDVSEFEQDTLEYIDDVETIELYRGKLLDSKTLINCEEFEAYGDMCPINSKVAEKVASIMAKKLNKPVKNLIGIAMQPVAAKDGGTRKMTGGSKGLGVFKRGV